MDQQVQQAPRELREAEDQRVVQVIRGQRGRPVNRDLME